ncbi:MAG: DUF3604 domain-containing protein [Alphaproteobacteria bacterium]|nr:DUF3604 domain-containing protein [Alphaproteobacteria bacterium]
MKLSMRAGLTASIGAMALLSACSDPPKAPAQGAQSVAPSSPAPAPQLDAMRNAYFGDLHVHTRNSFDAYIFNVRADADAAYRYAKGETIQHAAGYDIRLTDAPLDFLAVTDHSEYLGVLPAINNSDHPFSKVPYASGLFSTDLTVVNTAFRRFGDSLRAGKRMTEFASDMGPTRTAWAENIAAAERHYKPGAFTTFIGYEYTSAPSGRNLHRNVIFAGAKAPDLPFSALESQNPEELWKWLDARRAEGIEALAIPHNMNGSDGTMFERTKWTGEPIDRAWAELRARNEPLVEVTQVKGTSETHPLLSPNDEFAGFEVMEFYIGSTEKITKFEGGYVRDALKRGLEFGQSLGANPYKVGLIGSSDTHVAGGAYEEDNYFSKAGIMDAFPVRRGSVHPTEFETWAGYTPPANVGRYSTWGASGLTGVWAEENTRPSIYAGLRRKETFATTGPRIRVRFFAGFGLGQTVLGSEAGLRKAYADGVPMGGDLVGKAGASPDFLVWASRDPSSAPLQRLQIVKAWTDAGGKSYEKVFDVACSDGGRINSATQRCADNGATVDLKTCGISQDKGDAELSVSWKDPEFNTALNALYYVRVLENPTCRWSTWDALRAGQEPSPALEKTIQERAYTSPIWYVPTSRG